MLTTGFKLWFGIFVAALGAAVFAGYTSGGDETGPISLAWKGTVGNHVSYGLLMTAAAVALGLALFSIAFRDGDAEAAAELLDTDDAPPGQRPVGGSWWPVFAALGVGATAVGVVVHPVVFVIGICAVAAVAVEWAITNWSEKLSGDESHNAEHREKLMRPVEIPVLGVAGIGVLVLAMSRVLLASSVNGAVIVATVVGVVVLGGAVLISRNPSLPRGVVQGALLVGFVAVIVAGIVTAATGEREFHQKGSDANATDTQSEDGH
ncbi:MAG: hypothetical protein H8E59_05370 [Actinobacteria bacterium]|nr:hypothetical protein [Actinomycetota bacterium]